MSKALDLAGASACHSMIAGIAALKPIKKAPGVMVAHESEDGARRDYGNADRLIGEAFDGFAHDPSFRRTLANYLLMLYADGVPNMAKWTPQDLLTDDGFRGAEAQPGGSAAATDSARQALATEAAYEIEAVALLLQDMEHTSDNEYVMRGLFLRLEDLAGVVMSITGRDEDRPLSDMRAVVYGLRRAANDGAGSSQGGSHG